MTTIKLYGSLKKFGNEFDLNVETPAEAIRALSVQLNGFNKEINDGKWRIVRGELDDQFELNEEELKFNFGHENQLHILPVISGAGGDGAGKIIAGAALIGASFFVPGAGIAAAGMTLSAGTIATAGVALTLTGVSTALTAQQSTGGYEERTNVEERPSYLFDGPVNTAGQGLAVPVVIGEIKTGSVVVSAGLKSEQI